MLNRIYDTHKKWILLAFVISFAVCLASMLYLVLWNCVNYNKLIEFIKNFITNVITFISISFGFYLTSFSILFSSQYIKTLNDEDIVKTTQRKIHTLKEYFKLAIYTSLLTIGISFIVLFGIIFKNEYILIVMFSFLVAFFIENFIFIYLLLKIFTNALVTQAKP